MPVPLAIHVYGNATLVPETRAGWPDLLTSVLSERRVRLRHPVVNAGSRTVLSFADVVRSIGTDRRWLNEAVAMVALSHADGRSDRLAPSEAALFATQAVAHLKHRDAERVLVVGPTAGHVMPGKRPAVGYGSYPRWLRRTEKAVTEALGDDAVYVSLAGLCADLTRDGVRPTPAGWRWVAEQVADALVRGGQ